MNGIMASSWGMNFFNFFFQLPKHSLSDQLTTALLSNDQIPENVLLVNTAEWQGQVTHFIFLYESLFYKYWIYSLKSL